MTVVNSGGSVASPLNLTTAAASVLLKNLLLAADANPDFEITGDGKQQWGAGGASALDTSLARNSAGALRVAGGGNTIDIDSANDLIGSSGNLAIQIAGSNQILVRTTDLYVNTDLLLAGGKLHNAIAGNETTTATAGTHGAAPSQVVGYLSITDSGGTTRKVPYYAV